MEKQTSILPMNDIRIQPILLGGEESSYAMNKRIQDINQNLLQVNYCIENTRIKNPIDEEEISTLSK